MVLTKLKVFRPSTDDHRRAYGVVEQTSMVDVNDRLRLFQHIYRMLFFEEDYFGELTLLNYRDLPLSNHYGGC